MTTKVQLVTAIRRNNLTAFNHEGYVSLRLSSETMWNLAQALSKFSPPTVVGFQKAWRDNPSNEEILLSWKEHPWDDSCDIPLSPSTARLTACVGDILVVIRPFWTFAGKSYDKGDMLHLVEKVQDAPFGFLDPGGNWKIRCKYFSPPNNKAVWSSIPHLLESGWAVIKT